MAGVPPAQPGPRWGRVVVLALLIAALVGAVVGLLLVKTSSSGSTSLTLEPADASGSDPFTDSITNATKDPSAAAQAQFASTRGALAKDGTTGTLLESATAPGIYGGSGGVVYVDGRWYAASWNQQGAGLEGVITSTDCVNWSSAGDLPGGTAADLAAS